MRHRTYREEAFLPLQEKTLANVLRQLFITEFGYQNKTIFAEAMIERILETVDAYVKPASLLRPGQVLWMAVSNDGRKHAHQPMKEIPKVPVILDLVTGDDLSALASGEEFIAIRRRRHARLLEQTFAQGGVLAQGDLAALTLTAQRVVGRDIAHTRETEKRFLPYRGSVHDIGGTLTHKVEVIRLFEAGYLEPEICRLLPIIHDLPAVENYVQTYKNVVKLLEGGFAPSQISGILSIDRRLVQAYVDIVNEHHPEILAKNPDCQGLPSSHCSHSTQGSKDPK
jgi:hypothetical protein